MSILNNIHHLNNSSLIDDLKSLKEVTWFNKDNTTLNEAMLALPFTENDVIQASNRLSRFASFIKVAFPETAATNGIIESELVQIPKMKLELEKYYQFKTCRNTCDTKWHVEANRQL